MHWHESSNETSFLLLSAYVLFWEPWHKWRMSCSETYFYLLLTTQKSDLFSGYGKQPVLCETTYTTVFHCIFTCFFPLFLARKTIDQIEAHMLLPWHLDSLSIKENWLGITKTTALIFEKKISTPIGHLLSFEKLTASKLHHFLKDF